MHTKFFYLLLIFSGFIANCFGQSRFNNAGMGKETTPWYFQNPNDSISGISLDLLKVKKNNLFEKNLNKLTIAVIDTEIDKDHEELSYCIWKNTDEIPNNNIDDDNNGYIDDIHGWNFIGNKKGENIIYSNFETTRILRACLVDSLSTKLCKKAKLSHDKALKKSIQRKGKYESVLNRYDAANKNLSFFFKDSLYTTEDLKGIKSKDSLLNLQASKMIKFRSRNLTRNKIIEQIKNADKYINKHLNLEYLDRKILSENSALISDTSYGNNKISSSTKNFFHSTTVSSIIAAKADNTVGFKGITNNVKIMPVCLSSIGDEHDKDIALAIRYAVDNGAKIINMSSGKEFSMHPEWVLDALKYAEKKDVLFITSAGNNNVDLDKEENNYFPFYESSGDLTNNFIMVGASTENINSGLKRKSSSYGKKTVDIFAPGSNIMTALPNNKYKEKSNGTSYATPIVTGIAAIIRNNFPKLNAPQVKQILMESVTKHDVTVSLKNEDGSTREVPFSELSKSGGIVNAFNAVLLAEKMTNELK